MALSIRDRIRHVRQEFAQRRNGSLLIVLGSTSRNPIWSELVWSSLLLRLRSWQRSRLRHLLSSKCFQRVKVIPAQAAPSTKVLDIAKHVNQTSSFSQLKMERLALVVRCMQVLVFARRADSHNDLSFAQFIFNSGSRAWVTR